MTDSGARDEGLDPEEERVVDKLARAVVARGLVAPAILFLESVRPMNFVASQAMVFFAPMVGLLFRRDEYDALARLLERRSSIEQILSRIESIDAERRDQTPKPGQDGSGASSAAGSNTPSG